MYRANGGASPLAQNFMKMALAELEEPEEGPMPVT